MKKNLLRSGLVLMLMVGLLTCSFFTTEPVALATDEIQWSKNAITVQGTSSITVTPTIADMNIGVTTFHKDAVIAQSDNAKKMDLVYEALASLGIGKDKIKTIAYNINPRYEYKDNSSTLTGYDVTNGIQVTVMDLTKVSQVLDMTVKQGINQANSISFGITDQERDAFYLQALAKAVANAEAKAKALAAAVGVTVTKPAQITEGTSGYMVPAGYGIADTVKAENVATPISGGELEVEANVTVIYNY